MDFVRVSLGDVQEKITLVLKEPHYLQDIKTHNLLLILLKLKIVLLPLDR